MADGIRNPLSQAFRACRNCAAAKAKCVATLQNNISICARCVRLQLNCEAQGPIVRKRREPKAARMCQLENKLDSVLTLLKSSPSSGLPTISTQLNILSPAMSPQTSSSNTNNDSASAKGQTLSETHASTGLSDEENALVETFQMYMTSYFPFVALANINPAALRTQKPFLLATILLGASRQKGTRQKPAARNLLQSFTERCLLDGRPSLDLLQAILVYIQWCNYHFINNPQISILIQLAVSLVVELGLNKKKRPRLSRHEQLIYDATTQPGEDSTTSQCHSPEEMRAFLGCFYLSSIISASFKRVEAMAHTPYVEDCCATLEQHNEFPTDICLIKLVQTQIIVRKLAQSLPSDESRPLWNSMTPVGMIVKALESEVEKLFTQDMQTNIPFLLHYHAVQISLYEVGLRKLHHTPVHLNFPHLELRYSCLIAIMGYLDAFFLILPDLYFALPSVIWIQLADIIAVLARLLFISADGWDIAHARGVGNMGTMFERLEGNFEAASAAAKKTRAPNNDEDEDMFRGYAATMKRGKLAYENQLASELERTRQAEDQFGQPNNAVPTDFVWDESIFWHEALVVTNSTHVPWHVTTG